MSRAVLSCKVEDTTRVPTFGWIPTMPRGISGGLLTSMDIDDDTRSRHCRHDAKGSQ
jgi:hypothetical protein